MNKKDWENQIQIKSETDYYNKQNSRRKVQSLNFQDP